MAKIDTRAAHLKKLDDITAQDKIAMTAIKVSIPAIVMQMEPPEPDWKRMPVFRDALPRRGAAKRGH